MPLLGLGRRFDEFRFILARLKAHDAANLKGMLADVYPDDRPDPAPPNSRIDWRRSTG